MHFPVFIDLPLFKEELPISFYQGCDKEILFPTFKRCVRVKNVMVRRLAVENLDKEMMSKICRNSLLLEGAEQPRLIEEAIALERWVVVLTCIGQQFQRGIGVNL